MVDQLRAGGDLSRLATQKTATHPFLTVMFSFAGAKIIYYFGHWTKVATCYDWGDFLLWKCEEIASSQWVNYKRIRGLRKKCDETCAYKSKMKSSKKENQKKTTQKWIKTSLYRYLIYALCVAHVLLVWGCVKKELLVTDLHNVLKGTAWCLGSLKSRERLPWG